MIDPLALLHLLAGTAGMAVGMLLDPVLWVLAIGVGITPRWRSRRVGFALGYGLARCVALPLLFFELPEAEWTVRAVLIASAEFWAMATLAGMAAKPRPPAPSELWEPGASLPRIEAIGSAAERPRMGGGSSLSHEARMRLFVAAAEEAMEKREGGPTGRVYGRAWVDPPALGPIRRVALDGRDPLPRRALRPPDESLRLGAAQYVGDQSV